MPIVKIESCRQRSAAEVAALIEAVYQAQLIAFQLPENDKQIRYAEYPREHFPVPPDKSENFVIIEFLIFPGRSLAAKKTLYDGVVSRFVALGFEPRDVTIVLIEPPLENWGLRGQPASELDLGFKLDV